MMVNYLATFRNQPFAQLGRLDKSDVVTDTQCERAPPVGHSSKGKVSQCVEDTSLAYACSIQVMVLHCQFGTCKPFACFSQLSADALREAVFVIEFIFDVHL